MGSDVNEIMQVQKNSFGAKVNSNLLDMNMNVKL